MIEVARNSVQAWHIDQMGHMNVQFYVEQAMDGLAALALRLGLERKPGQQLVAANQHVRFLRELRLGMPFYVRAGVLGLAGDTLTVYQELVDSVSNKVSATFVLDVLPRTSATHAPCALPPAACAKAEQLRMELPLRGQPKGLTAASPASALTLEQAEALGFRPTLQTVVRAGQCDSAGWLTLRDFMGAISNAYPQLLAEANDVGGATLEIRFAYYRYPRRDDLLTLRSAIRHINDKTYILRHWLFDLESGAAVACADAVAITLDLEARRVIAIPPFMRRRLQSLLVDVQHA